MTEPQLTKLKDEVLETLRSELAKNFDYWVMKGWCVFPPIQKFENGVHTVNYKNGDEFASIMIAAANLKLEGWVRNKIALAEEYKRKAVQS